jgi:hypothetical protein
VSRVCPRGTSRTATTVCTTVAQGFGPTVVGDDFAKLILLSTEPLEHPGDNRAYLGKVFFESRLRGIF